MIKYFFQKIFSSHTNIFKAFLILFLSLNAALALTEQICVQVLHIPPLWHFLSLSKVGIENMYYWQLFSTPFLMPEQGLSLSWILSTILYLYLLSTVGSSLIARKGLKQFFLFYFSTALFVSLCMAASFYIPSSHFSHYYYGNKAMIGGLLFAWCMLYPDLRIQLFFIIPMKLTSLLFWTFFFHIFFAFSQGEFSDLLAYAATLTYVYLFCVLAWKQNSPFSKLQAFEDKAHRFVEYFTQSPGKSSPITSSKIYDFKTGKAIISDEAFFHAALAKISLKGKKSLRFAERIRFWKISRKLKKSGNI